MHNAHEHAALEFGAYAKVCGDFEWGSKMLGVNNMAVGLALLKAASRDEY